MDRPAASRPPAARFMAALVASWALPVAAASWHPVPGVEGMEVDLASAEQQQAVVTAWVRYAGAGPGWQPFLRESGIKAAGSHRAVLLAQFDCQQRTVGTLMSQAFDARGAPLHMSSVPTRMRPLPADEGLGWLYDALCELARARAAR